MSTSGTEVVADAGLAERFSLVRRIADDLAHELKNPLNSMGINLEVLRVRVRSGNVAAALERVAVLEQETRRVADLLDYVLRLLRPGQPDPTDFPVADLLAEVGALAGVLAKLARRGFEVRPVPDELRVHADREPLRFALLAVCEAAIAGLPDEADVVTLEATGERDVLVTLVAPAAAAARVEAAIPGVARLLLTTDTPLGVALDESGCRVRIALPRAAA